MVTTLGASVTRPSIDEIRLRTVGPASSTFRSTWMCGSVPFTCVRTPVRAVPEPGYSPADHGTHPANSRVEKRSVNRQLKFLPCVSGQDRKCRAGVMSLVRGRGCCCQRCRLFR